MGDFIAATFPEFATLQGEAREAFGGILAMSDFGRLPQLRPPEPAKLLQVFQLKARVK